MSDKKKVSTQMEPGLYRRVKLESARRGEQISDMIGEAVAQYLDRSAPPLGAASVVEETWGALALDRRRVDELMEDDGLFDA
jgi:hypothetical protein